MNTTTSLTDRIEKEIILKAPLLRVWEAISEAETFGRWFGAKLDGKTFREGELVGGQITIENYAHVRFEAWVESVQPQHYLAFRWHPYPVERGLDYSDEPKTLVEFRLKEVEGGTLLRVVETGFDQLPVHRRGEAFRMNSGGWEEQLLNIQDHVCPPPVTSPGS